MWEFYHLHYLVLLVLSFPFDSFSFPSVLLGISFLNRIWLLILTILAKLQLAPQFSEMPRQLEVSIGLRKTHTQNLNRTHVCYTFPKAIPTSQLVSCTACLGLLGEGKMFRKISLREASSPRQLREKYLLSSSLLIEKLEA